MTEEEAIELLKYHSNSHEDIYNPKWKKGGLGMLRPFTGEIYESNYIELREIIKTIAGSLKKDKIDRELIRDLWAICYLTRLWAVDEDGMLRRNKLLSDAQVELIADWMDDITMEIMFLLEGNGDPVMIGGY